MASISSVNVKVTFSLELEGLNSALKSLAGASVVTAPSKPVELIFNPKGKTMKCRIP